MAPHTALLNYFVGDDYVYVAVLTTTQLYTKQIIKPSNFDTLCANAVGYTQSNRKAYFDAAHQLYELLIEPLLEQLTHNITHLLVLPDAKLSEVPFEALLTHAVSHAQSSCPPTLFITSIQY